MFQLFLIYPIWGRWLQNCSQVFFIRSSFPAMMHLLYRHNCCNLSGGVALIVWFTTNGMRVNNNTIIYGRQASNSKRDCDTWSLLLLAATVRSFAHMLLGISDRNKMVRWPWCEGRAKFSLHTKNVQSVRFVVKRRECCCNLSGGVALIVWFTTNRMCVNNNTIIYGRQASNSKRDCDAWSLVACCHSVKLCAYAARDFRSQHNEL